MESQPGAVEEGDFAAGAGTGNSEGKVPATALERQTSKSGPRSESATTSGFVGTSTELDRLNEGTNMISSCNGLGKEESDKIQVPELCLTDAGVPTGSLEQEVQHEPSIHLKAGDKESLQHRTSMRQKNRRESQPEKVSEQMSPAPVTVREKLPPAERPINWFEGDLVWSLVSGHPLWPCIITADPESGSHTKLLGSGNASRRTYHVQFFGDSPEIAWINETRVYKFNGKDDYKTLVLSLAKKIPKRPPKVEISSRFIQNWNAGMEEIAKAMPMTTENRLKRFTFEYVNNLPKKPRPECHKEVEEESSIEPLENNNKDCVQSKTQCDGTGVKEKSPNASLRQKILPHDPPASPNGLSVISSDLSISETLDFVVKKYSSNDAELQKILTESLDNRIGNIKKQYACLYCQDIYYSLSDIKQHYDEKHPESEDIYNETSRINANLRGEIICPVCGEQFATKRSLGQHKRFTHSFIENGHGAKAPPVEKSRFPAKELIAIPVPIGKPKQDNVATTRSRSRPLLVSQGKKGPVCTICEKNGEVSTCTDCFRSFHANCLRDCTITDPFTCMDCKQGTHKCIICNKSGSNVDGLGELKRCIVSPCGRYFHSTCLKIYKLKGTSEQTEKAFSSGLNTRCPSHSCSTCISKAAIEDRRGGDTLKVKVTNRNRLFKCIRCPAAYHVGDECLAAGSVLLGGLSIICPSHFEPRKTVNHHHPVHISWCFVCSKGGELICCAACPAAFHAQCIDLDKTPEGDWHCLDCSCGIRPLYDDIVWVKLGTYRWWPGQVTHPSDIPDNISRLQHGPGEFVVKFFGSNDYFWLSKCRVFLYQEGDNGATNRHCSRGISGVFKKALQEAEEAFREVTTTRQLQEEVKNAENGKKPAPYKHIKCNKPIGNVQIYAASLSQIAKCTCRRTDGHPCGADSECLNRMLMYECHPNVCPSGDRCENQRFQKCDYPSTEVFKTEWGGWGLKTKVFIKKGSFVNEYVGELVDEEECRKRIEKAHDKNITNFYMLTIDKDRIIDAGPKGNYSRFMNHCCAPNCETQKWMVNGDTRVGLFAVRDIVEGEELTFNYNLDCLGNDKTKCMCGSENCSGFIGVRPKAQMEGVKRERKKKRKYRRLENLPQHDDFCFRCRQTGTLVCCDFKGCLRAFCLDCLHIDKPPYGKWECPCHHCDWCGRRAQYFCSFCPNSFCSSHVKNQLQPSIPNKFDTCTDHDPQKAEFEMAEVVAMVNDLMNTPLDELERASKDSTPRTRSPENADSGQEEGIVSTGQKRKRKRATSNPVKRNKKSSDSG